MLETKNKIKKSVLLIDNDKITHLLLQEILSKKIKLFCAECGQKGIDILKKIGDSIDVIFLDLFLPSESCFNIYHEIKQEYPSIPIIAVSSASISDLRERCISEGFDEIISKPININEFRKTVNKYIS